MRKPFKEFTSNEIRGALISEKRREGYKLQDYAERCGMQLDEVRKHFIEKKFEIPKDSPLRKYAEQNLLQKVGDVVWTPSLRICLDVFNSAFLKLEMHAVEGRAGSGKTFALNYYEPQNSATVRIIASNVMTSKDLLRTIFAAVGGEAYHTVNEFTFLNRLKERLRLQARLIIIDEADKLKPKMLQLLREIYDDLQSNCGIVLLGEPGLLENFHKKDKVHPVSMEGLISRFSMRSLNELNQSDVVQFLTDRRIYEVPASSLIMLVGRVNNAGGYRFLTKIIDALFENKSDEELSKDRIKFKVAEFNQAMAKV